uniref:Uncharacterized protein n=1 Tax=Utricularia reniformis TaxID=192314 RepID=A0A1Y0B3X0_9LAMI|nr:hypothetical protein AEK19_MT1993 [Utricularia reniformis]ART32155.1 hypothetical protein AEK19_MT1993 [Utricularia reniformis]
MGDASLERQDKAGPEGSSGLEEGEVNREGVGHSP